eukprot:scaffold122589_cov19-Tisochrysis_lutea.AAC.1
MGALHTAAAVCTSVRTNGQGIRNDMIAAGACACPLPCDWPELVPKHTCAQPISLSKMLSPCRPLKTALPAGLST